MATPPSDATLVQYLLGTLPPEDEERLDELSVVDPEFSERLRAIEHDLADAYVRGELPEADRQRWEQRYLASTQGLEDLRLAEALAARERGAPLSRRSSSFIWGLAAAAVLTLATLTGYLAIHRHSAPAVPAVTTIAPTKTPALERAPPRVVALTLAPAMRSLTEPPTLTVPPGTNEVRLTLRLEPDDYSRYTIAIDSVTPHETVWRATDVDAVHTPEGKALNAAVPAATFRSGRYLINVTAGTGHEEIVASYPLSIVLE